MQPRLVSLSQKNHKNQNHLDRIARDPSQIKYYNCQKIGHYANNCLEPKNQLSLENLFIDSWNKYRRHLAGVRLGNLYLPPN